MGCSNSIPKELSTRNSTKRRSPALQHRSVKLLCAQFERFERRQWLSDCSGLVMPPAPSEASGGKEAPPFLTAPVERGAIRGQNANSR